MRVSPYFLLGFGGEADVEVGPFSGENDLDPTVGLGVRFEVPIWDYISVGGIFAWAAFQQDAPGLDRDHLFDLDPMIKGRYVLDAGGMPLELHATFPVGFTVGSLDAENTDAAVGWNLGLLFGATLFVTDSIGVMAELGFMHHSVTSEQRGAEFDASATQGRLHLGASFAF
jgi:hypothetical protein